MVPKKDIQNNNSEFFDLLRIISVHIKFKNFKILLFCNFFWINDVKKLQLRDYVFGIWKIYKILKLFIFEN